MRKGSRSGCWHCRGHAPAAHTPLRSRRCNFAAVRTNSEHGPRGRNETARHASTHARHRRSLLPLRTPLRKAISKCGPKLNRSDEASFFAPSSGIRVWGLGFFGAWLPGCRLCVISV
jgi:hypothetical protein